MRKYVTVFAGNECRPDKQEYYYSLAYDTGRLLAKTGFTVVTGGGPGLMNEVMRGAYEAKGRTISVCLTIPGRLQSKFAGKRYVRHSLRSRQKKLVKLGEHYLAIPGGIGTLYEISEILARKRKMEIPENQKLILIDSYYHEFRQLIGKMKKEGFVNENIDSLYTIAKDPSEVIEILKQAYNEI